MEALTVAGALTGLGGGGEEREYLDDSHVSLLGSH